MSLVLNFFICEWRLFKLFYFLHFI